MRRADRLFQIVQHLRGRRLTTAAQLARWLQVSERTVYRDIRDLSLCGTPVEGEAGVGYRLSAGFDLPPIMFSIDEVEALVAAARMMESWGGPEMGGHIRSAVAKITLALPKARREEVERTRIFAPAVAVPAQAAASLEPLRRAIQQQHKVRVRYADSAERPSSRVLWPLGIYYWGKVWTLAAWCELRQDFRNFRLDRMSEVEVLAEPFTPTAGRTLEDFMDRIRQRIREDRESQR